MHVSEYDWRYAARPEVLATNERLCTNPYGYCLDMNFNPVFCATMAMCAFTFLCPTGFTRENERCLLKGQSKCPPIEDLSYTLEYMENIVKIENLPKHNVIENQVNGNDTCYYQVRDFLSTGSKVGTLNLYFDIVKRELILTTEDTLIDIKCYARAYRQVEKFPIYHHEKENFKHYRLDIDEKPHTYFCYVQAPSQYIPIKTHDMVAYKDTSFSTYILKILRLEDAEPKSSILFHYLYKTLTKNGFEDCRRFHETRNTSYYFIKGGDFRNMSLLNKIINEVINNSTLRKHKMDTFRVRNWKIEYLRNINLCLSETTSDNGIDLYWNETLVETVITPSKLCLNKDGTQVTRKCVGNIFTGAHWLEPSGNCFMGSRVPERTDRLYKLSQLSENDSENAATVFSNVTAETEDFLELTPTDVNLLADTFKTISKHEEADYLKILYAVDNILKIDAKILKESQERLNSTDKILDSIDNFVLNFAKNTSGDSPTIRENVLTQVTHPFVSNITGLAVYNGDNFDKSKIINIYRNQTFQSLDLENIELAVYVPNELIDSLTSNSTDEEKINFKIINTIYQDDRLFNQINESCKVTTGKIINVKIPGYPNKFNTTIPILIRPSSKEIEEPGCAYWDYGQQKFGKWSTFGGNYSHYQSNYSQEYSLTQCSYDHLTNFALLILSDESIFTKMRTEDVIMRKKMLEAHEFLLTLITLIGCSLSIIGVIGILFTAATFKDWYKRRVSVIHLSVIILLECLILLLADPDLTNKTTCKIVAAILHYIVLAKSIWMLLIARLQYLRFVNVFESVQIKSHIKLHTLLGWFLPLIPIILSFFLFTENYNSSATSICYAKGKVFYFFLFLPVGLIILTNFLIYLIVLVSIHRSENSKSTLQIALGIMFFFMLGITWIVGLIGELLPWNLLKIICIYLFCILGSIQGFITFIFSVILDKNSINLWKGKFNNTANPDQKFRVKTKYYAKNQVILNSEQVYLLNFRYFGKNNSTDF